MSDVFGDRLMRVPWYVVGKKYFFCSDVGVHFEVVDFVCFFVGSSILFERFMVANGDDLLGF